MSSVHILDKPATVFQISDCFYKDMPVEHVEDRLTVNGDFLLRNVRDTPHMVLSVLWDGKILHIEPTGTWRWWRVMYSFDNRVEFVSVDELVAHHYTKKVPLPNGVQLLRPIKTPNYKYAESDVYLVKKIGQGAFGEVFKVRIKSEDIYAALKTLKEDVTDRDRAAFMTEVQLMKCLNHKNVVRFLGIVDNKSGHTKILLEYVNQGSLYRLLVKGKVLPRGRLRVSCDSAQGVVYLHTRNVIHRDLATRNILINMSIDGQMICKVADFGMSRVDTTGKGYELKSAYRLPIKWTAPECFEHRIWSKASDVWSFGILVWEVFMNGKEPYNEPDVPQKPPDLTQYITAGGLNCRPADASEDIWRLLLSCWARQPGDRPSMAEVCERLQLLLQKHIAEQDDQKSTALSTSDKSAR